MIEYWSSSPLWSSVSYGGVAWMSEEGVQWRSSVGWIIWYAYNMCLCVKNVQLYSIMEIRKHKRRYYLQTMENEYSVFVA